MTPAQELARKARLVTGARAMLSMQVGLSVGAFRMQRLLFALGEPYRSRHDLFFEFISAIPAELPVGTARLHWAPKLLLALDKKLAKIEASYRSSLLEECIRIIEAYGPNNSSKPTPLRGAA